MLEAQEGARRILAIIESGEHEPETSYWLHATVAEARLLLGNVEGCRRALLDAVEAAPQAWEDRAATCRQLRTLLFAQGQDADVLAGLYPPPSLHFSGIMDLAEEEESVRGEVATLLDRIAAGSVYGALAAGADILVAEAALARGAQLHVVLPTSVPCFREVSVEPFGRQWEERFDALVANAHSLVELPCHEELTRAGVDLATEITMGMAIRRAEQLASEAHALHVGRLDEVRGAALSNWTTHGHGLHLVQRDWPRRAHPETLAPGVGHVMVACDRPFPASCEGQDRAVEDESGFWVLRCQDLAHAVRVACGVLRASNTAQLGLDFCGGAASGRGEEVAAEQAVFLARAAHAGEICAPWPHACACDLLAPEVRFEPFGELMTPFGDIPIARYIAPSCTLP